MRANNRSEPRSRDLHGLRNRPEIWVPRQNDLSVAPRRAYPCRCDPSLAPLASGKDEFLAAYGQAVQFARVVQANQPAIHMPARGELTEHRRHMTACPLDSAGPL